MRVSEWKLNRYDHLSALHAQYAQTFPVCHPTRLMHENAARLLSVKAEESRHSPAVEQGVKQ